MICMHELYHMTVEKLVLAFSVAVKRVFATVK